MKFIFGTKKFNDRVNRNVFWKCGAITYGIKTRTWGGNFKYFVQMGNRRNTLFWGSKFCNIYTGFEKPPRCFTYYAMLWNMVYGISTVLVCYHYSAPVVYNLVHNNGGIYYS